jgi:hypothetical protein
MAFNNLDDNYSFLNDYLNKVVDDSPKVDPNSSMEEDDDFFDTQNDDQDEGEPGIEYGLNDETHDTQDDSEQQENEEDNDVLDYLLGDNDPYSDQSDEEGNVEYIGGGEGDRGGLSGKISANESQGKYTAFNPKGGGAGAVGKYQFRWNIWKDSITKITGVTSREEFQHSPKAQEKYFAWYEKNYLKPAAEKLKPYNKMGLNDDQLAQLVHFRGAGGAKKYLQGKLKDKPEAYNIPISKYIAKHQMGGIAATPQQQYTGLNDESFNEMIFPMNGINTFRGLDDGQPVYLEDESGKKKVLRGRHDKTKMNGKVFEKRMQTGGEGPITFTNSYFESPEFKRRFTLDDHWYNPFNHSDYEGQMKYFNEGKGKYKPYVVNSNDPNAKTIPYQSSADHYGEDYIPGLPKGTNVILNPVHTNDNRIESDYELYNETLPHEYAHTIRNLSEDEASKIANLSKNGPNADMSPGKGHDNRPNEQYSDLNTFRWLMYKNGHYDVKNGDLDIDTLKKALKDDNIKNSPLVKRLLEHFTLENLVKFNNTIAFNNSNNQNIS